MQDMLYTVAEVAAILKCNVAFVHKLRKAGLLTFLKLGCYKCRKETLEKFLSENEGKDLTDPFDIKELKTFMEEGENIGGSN